MQFSKGLVRNEEIRMKLHQVNKEECDVIKDRWISDECTQALQKFFTRKSNL
jgi:peroxisomal 3,2-trans-enoyl-CoA isomerase